MTSTEPTGSDMDQLRAWEAPDAPTTDTLDAQRAAARVVLMNHLGSAGSKTRHSAPARRWRLIAPGALAVAACVGLLLSLGSGVPDGNVQPTPAAALDQVAQTAERSRAFVALGNSPGFLYTKSSGTWNRTVADGDGFSTVPTKLNRETWLRPIANGRRDERISDVEVDRPGYTAEHRTALREAGVVPSTEPQKTASTSDDLLWQGALRFSPDGRELVAMSPRQIYRKLLQGPSESQSKAGRDELVFISITEILRDGVLPGPAQAQLYRTLMLVPSLTVTTGQQDRLGRPSTVFGMDAVGVDGYLRSELLVNPATGEMRGERTITDTVQAGNRRLRIPRQVILDTAIERRAIVPRPSVRP